MSHITTRREFIRNSSLGAAALWLGTGARYAANNQLNIGIIGTANRGGANIQGVIGERIVAVCDIDDNYLGDAARRFPDAKKFNDFRKLLDLKGIDAVVISTPDHIHAPAGVMAMKAGMHVYCEKPLTHTVYEARVMAETAKKEKRVTQMGTQIHAGSNYRRVVELVQSGAIGPVREAHAWVGKSWGTNAERPRETPPVPAHIHWDLWLGPAPERPYHSTYLPAKWRRWWDFGGGTLGDMGCHYLDCVFWALKLRHPTAVKADGPKLRDETAPKSLAVHYDFPARKEMPAVKVSWWDGGRRPPQFKDGDLPKWGDGILFVGDRGMLLTDYTKYRLLPEDKFKDFKPPKPTIPNSIGHYKEWIQACKQGGTTTCNFDYSGALTESVLLGNVAYRVGEGIEWDGEHLKVTNNADAEKYIRRTYRKGWDL